MNGEVALSGLALLCEKAVQIMDLNPAIIKELRRRYAAGYSVKSLLLYIEEATGDGSVIMVLKYFMETFDLSFSQTRRILHSDFFRDGSVNEAELNGIMKPIIDANDGVTATEK